MTTRPANDGCALSEADVERIAARVVELLAPLVARGASPKYADRDCNPYGRPRAFLDAARRGDFPAFRRCRKLTALWADVEAAIERQPPAPEPGPADIDIDALLQGARPKARAAS